MDIKEALNIAEAAIYDKEKRHLNDAEIDILQGSWEGETYNEIAESSRYEVNYLKGDIGHKFWKLLSEALGEQVSKRNFRAALERSRFLIGNSMQLQLEEAQPSQKLVSDLHVERPSVESRCYEEIMQPGALLRIKAPSLMGKTQLMNRILQEAEKQGYQTVSLSFELAEEKTIEDVDKFLRWFCAYVGKGLQLDNQLNNDWNDTCGSKVNCTGHFEQYLLKNVDKALVLGLEELDQVFKHPHTAAEFLSMLRAWHEQGKRSDIWKKLRLILVHSREVNIPLHKNHSPFNVGLPIELPEFNFEQVQELAYKYGLNWHTAEVEKLMYLVGGHPYLVDIALNHISHDYITLEQLLQTASTEAGFYGDHLRQYWLNLQQYPKQLKELEEIVDKGSVRLEESNSKQVFELNSMGLLKLDNNKVTIRCKLYFKYFQERLQINK